MVNLKIDGREFKAEEGATILEVAKSGGIEIPTLCHHDAVKPYGACRVCMVEITKHGRTRLVTSCLYPAEEGLEVQTNSERVRELRKGILELLLSRCPNVKVLQDLAKSLGISKAPFVAANPNERCILCGLCTRVCQEVVGVSAISLVSRGTERKVSPPFEEPSQVCIGCGSCAVVCPTDAIKVEDVGDTRIIHNWKVKFKMKQCRVCGKYFAPEAQLNYIRKTLDLPEENFELCQECRVKTTASV
jgi:bidirectional [NiFe] hydrogenase diaphorase subunit